MFSIPEEKLPECFKNDLRLNVLYAPLRSKSVNPSDWNSKITSWSQLINIYSSCNKVYKFSLDSLRIAFHQNGRSPSCLKEVIQEMVKSGDIELLDIFLQEKPKSWKEWATNVLISSPISWSLNKMKSMVTNLDNTTLYVPVKILEQESDFLLSKIELTHKNKVMNMKDILEKQDVDMNNAENYKLLFISLRNRGKVQIIELPHKDDLNNFLVKFSGDHELLPISEVDLAVYNLERNEKVLEKNIEILEDNISGCVDEAKHHLKKGHKQLAKACLRKKHEIEKRVDKKLEALQNVQILLQRLQDTKMDNSVWESYKKSLAALEATYNKGFNEDAVEDTMLKIGEMLEINSDIQNTLSRPLIQEDADLEEELAELMNDKNDGNSPQNMDDLDLSKLNISLPDVPNSPISDTSEKNISTQLI